VEDILHERGIDIFHETVRCLDGHLWSSISEQRWTTSKGVAQCGPKIRYLRDPSQRADLKSEAVGQGVSEEYRLRVWPFAGSFALDRHSISFDHIRCFFCDHNGWCIRISGD